ncbi:MAG: carboxypeptidase M32 [Chitinophagaceae bacterium]|nr:carboxypeptidase M32 [Chitinophagaceae bacterium]
MSTHTKEKYKEFVQRMRRIADVRYANAVLQWDQETYLPPKGAALRGQQMATLSEIAHDLFTDASLGTLLNELSAAKGLTEQEEKNIALTLEDYNKNKKYSSAFVRKMSEATSKAYHAWINARKQNSFRVFEKELDELVQLKKEETQLLGYAAHPYDALLNEYEKGATVQWLDKLFDDLQVPLKALLNKLENKTPPETGFLHQHFDTDAQWKFGLEILKLIGYDFEAGRQDISEHPFTTNFNAHDVRVTTRIDENDFTSMTWSCLHEGGHGLYEQGLPVEAYGLPAGEFCSLGIHESQSRLWENCVGRSREFIAFVLPVMQRYFPQLHSVTARQLFGAVNKVQPSLIRTESDELTYHFHVMIRYQVEKLLMEGSLLPGDIPAYWNELYKKYLGVTVPDDKNGCLQDIHWSHGSFGYFPAYTLGSLYAAQFYHAIKVHAPGLDKAIGNGDFSDIHSWLQTHVYQYGRTFTSDELCNKITGESLRMEYFMDYISDKYNVIY